MPDRYEEPPEWDRSNERSGRDVARSIARVLLPVVFALFGYQVGYAKGRNVAWAELKAVLMHIDKEPTPCPD